jgi:Protein of unknown function (DUF2917)
MRLDLESLPVNLSTGSGLNVADADGVNVRVLRGRVWITQEGSLDDTFLDAGNSHRLEGDGRVVISAEGRADARIAFETPFSVQSRSRFAGLPLTLFTAREPHRAPLHLVHEAV